MLSLTTFWDSSSELSGTLNKLDSLNDAPKKIQFHADLRETFYKVYHLTHLKGGNFSLQTFRVSYENSQCIYIELDFI